MSLSKTPQPLVSICIVTYNSAKYIDSCLRSVAVNAYWPFEIIIVDNNSTDATYSLISQVCRDYPHLTIRLIQEDKNLGYAAANNQAATKALGTYLFFLNPDTVVDSHFLVDLVATAELHPTKSVIQPTVFLQSQPTTLNLTGKVPSYLGFDWIANYLAQKTPPAQQIYSVSGSAFLLPRQLFLKIGGFDESYFMYYEDSDLSWRLQLLGYQIWFCDTSIVHHDYKFSPDEVTQTMHQKLFYAERNRLITLIKNYQTKTLLILLPALLILEVALLGYAVLGGWGVQKLRGYWQIFRLRATILHNRRQIQKSRTVNDQIIFDHLAPTITFSQYDHPILTHILNPFFAWYYGLVKRFI